MGANNNTVTTYGWSKSGDKTYSEQLSHHTEKVNLLAAYRYHDKELIAPFEYKGSTDFHLFCGWFEQCLCPILNPGDYVIWDNAAFIKAMNSGRLQKNLTLILSIYQHIHLI